MRIPALLAALALVGCGKSQPAEPQTVAVVVQPEPVSVALPAPTLEVAPQPTPVPPSFAFPADAAGEAVTKVVTPAAPPPLPIERFGAAPKARPVPTRVMEPDTGARTAHQPPRIALSPVAVVKPVAPPERLPVEIGVNSQQVPAKPMLPETPLPTPRARDVNAPPDLPILGRPVSDRASLDDPTVEAGHAAITGPLVSVTLAPSEFRRVALPDPFELGEHVKPKVAPAAEPGSTPVPVTPKRPK
jgi:hypothetical protein